ncbi:hypothetical protein Spla01_00015 [Streptomyces platensis]|uniref:SnoaL-like domain-containing protein n=1 Tax=Streptomyces platensis TaxID=58346 RepID=A0ABX3Y778_STRPT|nr:hypothetical protein [Streptomyces platensis]OSY48434.1 hypothetical protein BG653_00311 [Streptomyces platensis]
MSTSMSSATTGEQHRNVEVMTVRDGRVTETQVYFGGNFPQG